MAGKRKNLLFILAGAREEVLELCPSERIKFQSLGLGILITSSIATVSMWFALNSALGVNPAVSLLAAILWGLVIMGIDRWLVTSMPSSGTRRWKIALPRLLLALLLGSLISTPIVLRIFQSEINAQIVIIKQQRASAFILTQQNSPVGQQVAFWTKDVSNLQKVIDSGGSAPINPSTDPQVVALTKQRTAELRLEHMYYEQWQCQLYGTGCPKGKKPPKGNGQLAQASHRSYELAAAQVTRLTNQIQARDKQLSATDARSKKARYQQAQSALPNARAHLQAATARENALQAQYDSQNLTTNGLLIRLQALNDISGRSFTINVARLLLFLLFLVIECLPVSVKLLQQPGIYEKILQTKAEQELKDARQSIQNDGRAKNSRDPGGKAPVSPEAEMRKMWQSSAGPASPSPAPGRPKPAPSPPKPAMAEPSRESRTETEDSTHLVDRALRVMHDATVTADSDMPAGGIELHYGADER